MATRKNKSSSPLHWLRRLYQRLTSRMACFVWGALFGNVLLIQPIEPLNVLLAPPEYMLSPIAHDWLEAMRAHMRSLGNTFSEAAWQTWHKRSTEASATSTSQTTPQP